VCWQHSRKGQAVVNVLEWPKWRLAPKALRSGLRGAARNNSAGAGCGASMCELLQREEERELLESKLLTDADNGET
jgi:hypothetical protein